MCVLVFAPDGFAQAGTRHEDALALHLQRADTEQVLPLRVPAEMFNKRM